MSRSTKLLWVVVISSWFFSAAAQEEPQATTQNDTSVAEPVLQTSDLKQWYCKAQDVIDSVSILHGWFDRVKKNSLMFVDDNGQSVAAPIDTSWKKSPECLNSERTDEKSEKTEKIG